MRALRCLGLGIISLAVILVSETVASALIITPTFDSTITSNPNAAAIEGSINAAIGIFQSQFSTPITATIDFRYDTTTPCGTPSDFIGASCIWEYASDYTAIVGALTAQATTANDATAVAHLPGSISQKFIITTSADTRALGCATCSGGELGSFDGIVTLNSSEPLQFSRSGGISAGNYDAQTALEHEIDEVLGIGGSCEGTYLPCTMFKGQTAIGIMDLFRYSAPGELSSTTDPSATAYFSIDGGATDIVDFNQSGDGDYGDFASGCFVQSFAECAGTSADVTLGSPEGVALDVIGYDPVSEPSSLVLCATTFLGLAWRRRLAAIAAALFMVGLMAPGLARADIVLSIPSDTVSVGEVFTLPVSVSGTAGLTSYQFDLAFNPAILEVLSFDDTSTDFATEATNEGGFLTGITGFVDNTSGLLSGIADSMSGNSGPGLTPSGTIADITFEALHSGDSALTCSNGFLTDNNNFLSSANGDFSFQCGDVRVPEPATSSILGVALFILAAAQWMSRGRRKPIQKGR